MKPDTQIENKNTQPQLTVADLIQSESEILQRIGEDIDAQKDGVMMAGHYSNTGGHTSKGAHSSHTSKAMKENPFEV